METTKSKKQMKLDQEIRVVDGEFTPSEACDIVNSLLDQKINFHKLQRLAMWEGNVNANCSFPNGRIEELEQEKIKFKQMVDQARKQGAMLQLKANLEVTLTR